MGSADIRKEIVDRVVARRGKLHLFDSLEPTRTALLVIDMQNAFLMEGVAPNPVATAREIVPNINRLAATLRQKRGIVVWIKHTIDPATASEWSVFHDELSTPEFKDARYQSMQENTFGHQLWAALTVAPADLTILKSRFSAFIQGSSDLEQVLRARGIDTVLVTGTITGTCCESTARDAMMRNFKVVMVADANAARSDDEHNAALIAVYTKFGDLMTTDELIACLERNSAPVRAQPAAAL
jgi:ureidoacrylate peracid hydrolase